MSPKSQKMETLIRQLIPLSDYMQVKVLKADSEQVTLTCKLEPNHNHLGTAFGGSLSCLMILAAYCRTFQLINENGHVLLQSSSMEFLLPVEENLVAVCKGPSANEVQDFLKALSKKRKARLNMKSEIVLADGRVACTMTGEFVAIP